MLDTKALAEATAGIVLEHVAKATAPLLKRIEELEARSIPVLPDVASLIADAVAALPTPQDGKSVTLDDVRPIVAQAVADIPKPQDGKSVELSEVVALVDAAVKQAVSVLPAPKDGVGVAGAIIDRTGSLVVTLSDGSAKELGPVVGRDADQGALFTAIDEKIAALPKAKNGADGLGFDDLTVEQTGERSFAFRFVQGERVKEFSFELPVVLDRGVYKDGQEYSAGDAVTWAGSVWIAQKDTAAKPDSGDGWRLAVKRGRDGKDAR